MPPRIFYPNENRLRFLGIQLAACDSTNRAGFIPAFVSKGKFIFVLQAPYSSAITGSIDFLSGGQKRFDFNSSKKYNHKGAKNTKKIIKKNLCNPL